MPQGRNKYYQGYFMPYNKDKYVGDIDNIFYRSSWERKFMIMCDKDPNVIRWSSEPLKNNITYINPLDGKTHHYIVDFWLEMRNGKKVLVEIKPYKQTVRPKFDESKNYTSKRLNTYNNELKTYITNLAKWNAAKNFCERYDWEFNLITEKTLNVQ